MVRSHKLYVGLSPADSWDGLPAGTCSLVGGSGAGAGVATSSDCQDVTSAATPGECCAACTGSCYAFQHVATGAAPPPRPALPGFCPDFFTMHAWDGAMASAAPARPKVNIPFCAQASSDVLFILHLHGHDKITLCLYCSTCVYWPQMSSYGCTALHTSSFNTFLSLTLQGVSVAASGSTCCILGSGSPPPPPEQSPPPPPLQSPPPRALPASSSQATEISGPGYLTFRLFLHHICWQPMP